MSLLKLTLSAVLLMVSLFLNAQNAGCIGGDCYNGVGTYFFGDKTEYTGQWLNGFRTGVGSYDWADGSYYLGYFKDGKLEGNGIYVGNDEAKTTLIGVFHDGQLVETRDFGTTGCLIGNCYEGVGIYLWESDDLYIGEWHNGVRTGYGRFDWGEGGFYTGFFKNDLLDGKGYYEKEGKVMDGYFEKNSFIRDDTETVSAPADAAENFSYITYDDVCELLKEVIRSFPDHFTAVKGKKQISGTASSPWQSSVSMKNSVESGLLPSKNDTNVPGLWYNKLYSTNDFKAAMDQYNQTVSSFSGCISSCCTFRQNNESKEKEEYVTYFNVVSTDSAHSTSYKDMNIGIKLSNGGNGSTWMVEVQVKNESSF